MSGWLKNYIKKQREKKIDESKWKQTSKQAKQIKYINKCINIRWMTSMFYYHYYNFYYHRGIK